MSNINLKQLEVGKLMQDMERILQGTDPANQLPTLLASFKDEYEDVYQYIGKAYMNEVMQSENIIKALQDMSIAELTSLLDEENKKSSAISDAIETTDRKDLAKIAELRVELTKAIQYDKSITKVLIAKYQERELKAQENK